MDFSEWVIEPLVYENSRRLVLRFSNRPEWNNYVRGLRGARWSPTLRAWHVADNTFYRMLFRLADTGDVLSAGVVQQLEIFTKWLLSRRYSERTVKTYIYSLRTFLLFFSGRTIDSISNEDVIEFNNSYILRKKLSVSYQNQMVNAIKLFFSTVCKTKIEVENIHRPRREKRLPNVLSKEEIRAILGASNNIKHRAMLSLIYGCGLRRSELLNLRPADVDSHRGLLIIRQAKGKRDRVAPLSVKLVMLLREYYRSAKPRTWLFEGHIAGEQYGERSLQLVLRSAVEKAGIRKPVSLHWLRHSYATHLLEAGTDLRYIQEILGHKSSRTTELYTHVSTRNIKNIISPFDDL